jgi:hypothetical protein
MQDKVQLETSLETALALVKDYFEVEDCHWDKRFHAEQQECRECAERYVCEWLFQQDPAPDLSICPSEQLHKVLTFAAGYLKGHMLRADHEDNCPCATCVWVRETHSLLQIE